MGETTVLNSTIANNVASGAGTQIGGIGNTGLISLQNSIVAQNQGRNCRPNGNWTSLGYNLSNGFDCDLIHSDDLPGTPANLAPLASYNSGFGEMHGLLPGSAAIDGGQ